MACSYCAPVYIRHYWWRINDLYAGHSSLVLCKDAVRKLIFSGDCCFPSYNTTNMKWKKHRRGWFGALPTTWQTSRWSASATNKTRDPSGYGDRAGGQQVAPLDTICDNGSYWSQSFAHCQETFHVFLDHIYTGVDGVRYYFFWTFLFFVLLSGKLINIWNYYTEWTLSCTIPLSSLGTPGLVLSSSPWWQEWWTQFSLWVRFCMDLDLQVRIPNNNTFRNGPTHLYDWTIRTSKNHVLGRR